MEWIDIKTKKPAIDDCGTEYLCAVLVCNHSYDYEVAEWFDREDGESEPFFSIRTAYCGQQSLSREVTHWAELPILPSV